LETHLFTYRYGNAEWEIEIPASSEQEARERLARIPYATYDGVLIAKIPAALGVFGKAAVYLRNSIMPSIVILLDRHFRLLMAAMLGSLALLVLSIVSGNRWEVLTAAGGSVVFGWIAGSISTFNALTSKEACDIDDTSL